ncbi:LysR family transcriptional regulator [Marivita hallyeonensis]|uniref:Transcriptional regulator, LysR family n=1 Tax=Marivita hallyeonensis TaxID=996342 RepID=A0A1M5R6W6_9RHOB|nr:LysR family transcriptional regulator [Marivita hallyeonensis]SHH21583.1 transcriptional regulator, LysR family [Marivita hallyeonensis]
MHNLNWDDLRFVLAVAETGSVNAAAKALSVNHATVLRRIAAFEDACGGPVFEREKSGYRLRPDRAQVIEAARHAAQHVSAAEALMRGGSAGVASILRITSTDTLCQTLLPKILPALARRAAPDRLAILSSNAHLDMARLHADLTIRPAATLADDLFGRQIGLMRFGVFSREGVKGPWLGLAGPLANSVPAKWMAGSVAAIDIAATSDSFAVLARMAQEGAGQVILPCLIGDSTPRLKRVETRMPDFTVPVWVACHRDLAGSEKLRSLMGSIEKLFVPHQAALAGDDPRG